MITIYNSQNRDLQEVSTIFDGVWVNMVKPTETEIQKIAIDANVDTDFIRAALDEEERSRIEVDNDTDSLLIVVDVPFMEIEDDTVAYETLPLGIIFTKQCLITVSLKETLVLQSFISNNMKTFYTFKKSRFILQILYRNATLYLKYLKQIDKQSNHILDELEKSMKNKELLQLMELEKSLVYFSTSLRSNELVMEKLLRYEFIKKYPDDTELLEDTIIENKQAIEMAKIYSDILSGQMDAFASIISNNLNIVMKFLACITIIMAIPAAVSGFFGMNVAGIPVADHPFGFFIVLAITLTICITAAIFMAKKNMM